jgi:D-glycero-alpha-D-manno-heptose 1-phosphate guanylyltransferase
MQAIILCGGEGTRLRSVIGEKQKTMTEVGNEPFLVNVIKHLKKYKVTNVIFATGYKSHEVKDYFGNNYYFGVEVHYSEEKIALGTGGAIRNCLDKMKYDYALVLNGDTLFQADLKLLENNFLSSGADMTIACKEVDDKSRYGSIRIDYSGEKTNGNKEIGAIVSFNEKVSKKTTDNGNEAIMDNAEEDDLKHEKHEKNIYDLVINGGIYIIKKDLIETIPVGVKSSLEKDLIPKWLTEGKLITAEVSDERFIDIGTPDSLKEFKERKEEFQEL